MLNTGYTFVNPLTFLDAIPETSIAVTVYVVGACVVLWCWYRLVQNWPKPFGGISWLLLMSIICTPTISDGANAGVAPAIFGLIFGVLTQNQMIIWTNLSLILFVLGLGLLAGYFWSKYTLRLKQTAH